MSSRSRRRSTFFLEGGLASLFFGALASSVELDVSESSSLSELESSLSSFVSPFTLLLSADSSDPSSTPDSAESSSESLSLSDPLSEEEDPSPLDSERDSSSGELVSVSE
uniref:Putative secreted protein n=1 Tax=Ixodes ricinus TaxID=34613 RepID=A0A6B0UIV1_IXORI